ANPEVRNNLP
nr:RecName: Full=23 kDa cell wall protein [Solanum lycopersicum]